MNTRNPKTQTISRSDYYDVIVIGGGPAGLTAAYFATKEGCRTLLFEKLPHKGKLSHPEGGAIWPIPKLVTLEKEPMGIKILETDFLLPNRIIIGASRSSEFIGPNNARFGYYLPKGMLAPVIDKSELLKILAKQAEVAGATLAYGQRVTGLIKENGYVTGVKVGNREFKSSLVISAEGIAGKLCEEAGLQVNKDVFFAYIVAYYLTGLKLEPHQATNTLYIMDDKYIGAPRIMGGFAPQNRQQGQIYVAIFSADGKYHNEKPITDYLNRFMETDPRVKELCRGAIINKKTGCRLTVRALPHTTVSDGFIGVGDAVVAGGEMLSAPAMVFARLAAEVGASSIRKGDISATNLIRYNQWLKHPYVKGLESQYKTFSAYASLSTLEIGKAFEVFNGIDLWKLSMGTHLGRLGTMVKLIPRLPAIILNWDLMRRFI
ncbi:MAG: NAD(P)/FAD-dependent oxidoreductase [Spirochaetota bacterium]